MTVMGVFVGLGITSVLDSIENIFSPKSSISSALNTGWSHFRLDRNTKFPTNTEATVTTLLHKQGTQQDNRGGPYVCMSSVYDTAHLCLWLSALVGIFQNNSTKCQVSGLYRRGEVVQLSSVLQTIASLLLCLVSTTKCKSD